MNISINRELVNEIQEVIEDTVGYVCNENMISGELVQTRSLRVDVRQMPNVKEKGQHI